MIAWHFLKDGKTRDGIPVHPGQMLHVDPPLVMCERGLHACRRVIDALHFAPGFTACLVELSGQIEHEDKGVKYCASDRKCLGMVDATRLMHEFAIWCVERVCVEPLLDVKRQWLDGQCSLEDLDRARTRLDCAVAGQDMIRAALSVGMLVMSTPYYSRVYGSKRVGWREESAMYFAEYEAQDSHLETLLRCAMCL